MGKVVSTNIGEKVTIVHNNEEVQTGIYKYSVDEPIFLGATGVNNDNVIDTRYHGGKDKACYIYPSENYNYWNPMFPNVNWEWGMFGENLTTEGFLESDVRIGATYKIGEAIVQVSQPRQPCYKLGVRLGDPKMVKLFTDAPYPGVYLRVLEPGFVKAGDAITLLEDKPQSQTISDIFALLMNRNKSIELTNQALSDQFLAESAKRDLMKIMYNNTSR